MFVSVFIWVYYDVYWYIILSICYCVILPYLFLVFIITANSRRCVSSFGRCCGHRNAGELPLLSSSYLSIFSFFIFLTSFFPFFLTCLLTFFLSYFLSLFISSSLNFLLSFFFVWLTLWIFYLSSFLFLRSLNKFVSCIIEHHMCISISFFILRFSIAPLYFCCVVLLFCIRLCPGIVVI